MVAILRGNVQQGGFVADMVITGGIAGNILTSPINANALPATFDGSSIFALNASNVSTGVLSVLRGGTGVSSSTGSGNLVLNVAPTFQGLVTVAGNLAASSLTVSNIVSSAGMSVTNSDPGVLVEKRYGAGTNDRYGIGQYTSGALRMYVSQSYPLSKISMCVATGETTFNDILVANSTSVAVTGNLTVGGNISVQGTIYGSMSGYGLFTPLASQYSTGTQYLTWVQHWTNRLSVQATASEILVLDSGAYVCHLKLNIDTWTTNTSFYITIQYYDGTGWADDMNNEFLNSNNTRLDQILGTFMVYVHAGYKIRFRLSNTTGGILAFATPPWSQLMMHKVG